MGATAARRAEPAPGTGAAGGRIQSHAKASGDLIHCGAHTALVERVPVSPAKRVRGANSLSHCALGAGVERDLGDRRSLLELDKLLRPEAATGLNLWREWAKVEIAGGNGTYEAQPSRDLCAGIVLSLARQEWPDMSAYTDPEIVTRIRKRHHAGLIVASPDAGRVGMLLDSYTQRFYADFHASAPPPASALE